jgi:hypothetical protein
MLPALFFSTDGGADHIAVAQTHRLAGRAVGPERQAKVIGGRVVHEVVGVDPQFARELERAGAEFRQMRVHRYVHFLGLVGRVVVEHQLDRLQHRDRARRTCIEVVAQRLFEHAVVDPLRALGDAGALDEELDRLRREAAPAQPDDGRHARVVPAVDEFLVDQLDQLALAHHDVGEVQAVELGLARQQEEVGLALGRVRPAAAA